MTLWRLEWLRLFRTRRAVALGVVYAFFGFLGPITARYLGEIIDRFGGDITVTVPDPEPIDGIAQFAANAQQVGLLVVVVIAAGALTLRGLPEMTVFLRTRTASSAELIIPRYAVSTAAAASGFLLGTGIAWYETAALIGGLPIGSMLLGTLFGVLYLAFAIAVVAAFGSRVKGVVGTVAATLLTLLALPLIGVIDSIGRWLPSHLLGAQVDLVGSGSAGGYVQAVTVTAISTLLLVALAIRSAKRLEL
jgi:ABC-2 type transport system permease protein